MNGITLNELTKDRNNNLNIMRFIAALTVIFSHACPISTGESDILVQWTNGWLSFGGIAVGVFFCTGGYLIAKSAEGKKSFKQYFAARCWRIFPQLIFVIFLTALVIGPFLSSLSMKEYYQDIATWKYLLNSVFILEYELPGVFENNIYATIVNGAIWTLPLEFMCYIMCFIAYKIKILSKNVYKYTIPLAVLVAIASMMINNSYIYTIVRPVILFYIGMGFYVYREDIKMNHKVGVMSILLVCLGIGFNLDKLIMLLVFPYMIFYIAFGCKYKFVNFGKNGEYSYGIYLWGCLVGQIVCMFFGGKMHWFLNAVLTSIISIILGIINYYIVDKTIDKWQRRNYEKNSDYSGI